MFKTVCYPVALCFALSIQACSTHQLSRETATLSRLATLGTAAEQFRSAHDTVPGSLRAVCLLVAQCARNFDEEQDAWGNRLMYDVNGANFTLRSGWQDGRLLTPDDVIWTPFAREVRTEELGCFQISAPRAGIELGMDLRGEQVMPNQYRAVFTPASSGVWTLVDRYIVIEAANGSHIMYLVFERAGGAWAGYVEADQLERVPAQAVRVPCAGE